MKIFLKAFSVMALFLLFAMAIAVPLAFLCTAVESVAGVFAALGVVILVLSVLTGLGFALGAKLLPFVRQVGNWAVR
jgi:hypothetical protein